MRPVAWPTEVCASKCLGLFGKRRPNLLGPTKWKNAFWDFSRMIWLLFGLLKRSYFLWIGRNIYIDMFLLKFGLWRVARVKHLNNSPSWASSSSWWLNQPMWKIYVCQIGNLLQFSGLKKKQYLKPPAIYNFHEMAIWLFFSGFLS